MRRAALFVLFAGFIAGCGEEAKEPDPDPKFAQAEAEFLHFFEAYRGRLKETFEKFGLGTEIRDTIHSSHERRDWIDPLSIVYPNRVQVVIYLQYHPAEFREHGYFSEHFQWVFFRQGNEWILDIPKGHIDLSSSLRETEFFTNMPLEFYQAVMDILPNNSFETKWDQNNWRPAWIHPWKPDDKPAEKHSPLPPLPSSAELP